LYFLDFMAKTRKTPSQLLAHLYDLVGPSYYDRDDITFQEAERSAIIKRMQDASPASVAGFKVCHRETADGFRFLLEGGSWLLVRFSGTEPLLRVYAESGSLENVERLLDAGAKMAGVKDGS
jgi:phosphomannomutase